MKPDRYQVELQNNHAKVREIDALVEDAEAGRLTPDAARARAELLLPELLQGVVQPV